eukprot:g15326.t1
MQDRRPDTLLRWHLRLDFAEGRRSDGISTRGGVWLHRLLAALLWRRALGLSLRAGLQAGVECGSIGFWLLYFGAVPWVLAFALGFRRMLVSEFHQKLQQGYTFQPGEVRWDSRNTLLYPLLCAIAGLLAGLFGVGGGIVKPGFGLEKGPLMLEMGIMPSVASASAAAMILYTSAAASASPPVSGASERRRTTTEDGVTRWVHKQNRQSPIVLSIGTVILLSSVFVAINTVVISIGRTRAELLAFHGVCDSAA